MTTTTEDKTMNATTTPANPFDAATRKQNLIACLRAFVAQRPGLEFADYGDVAAYRSEMRGITKDRHQAEKLIDSAAWRDGITADRIIDAAQGAFSGRLTITEKANGTYSIGYCTGQYFPTEYRRAVCAVMASAFWTYFREDCNAPTGTAIWQAARREFPAAIVRRWFN